MSTTDERIELSMTSGSGIELATANKVCKKNVKITPTLQEKTVSQNGDVTPDNGYAGLSKVTVNAPIGIIDVATTSEMDALLVSSNLGNVYRFTGTTDNSYRKWDLYTVVQDSGSSSVRFKRYMTYQLESPTEFSITSLSLNNAKFTWRGVEGATGYNVSFDGQIIETSIVTGTEDRDTIVHTSQIESTSWTNLSNGGAHTLSIYATASGRQNSDTVSVTCHKPYKLTLKMVKCNTDGVSIPDFIEVGSSMSIRFYTESQAYKFESHSISAYGATFVWGSGSSSIGDLEKFERELTISNPRSDVSVTITAVANND